MRLWVALAVVVALLAGCGEAKHDKPLTICGTLPPTSCSFTFRDDGRLRVDLHDYTFTGQPGGTVLLAPAGVAEMTLRNVIVRGSSSGLVAQAGLDVLRLDHVDIEAMGASLATGTWPEGGVTGVGLQASAETLVLEEVRIIGFSNGIGWNGTTAALHHVDVRAGMSMLQGNDIVIDGMVVTDSLSNGLTIIGPARLTNITASGNAVAGLVLQGATSLIGCHIENNGAQLPRPMGFGLMVSGGAVLQVRDCVIQGNGVWGIWAAPPSLVDAALNEWGSVLGPSVIPSAAFIDPPTPPPLFGNAVTEGVVYAPWTI